MSSKFWSTARILGVVIILLNIMGQAIPLAYPLGLPVPISTYTQQFYDTLVNLPAGAVVGLDLSYSTGLHVLTEKQILLWLSSRQIRWVGWSLGSAVPVSIIDGVIQQIKTEYPAMVYGTDMVYLGYIPGELDIVASLVTGALNNIQADYQGTPRSQLPLLAALNSKADFQAFIGCQDRFDIWARWWPNSATSKSMVVIRSDSWPDFQTYYPNTFTSGLNVPTAAAEWEAISGMRGGSVAFTDGISVVVIYTVILIVVENLLRFRRKTVVKTEVQKQ